MVIRVLLAIAILMSCLEVAHAQPKANKGRTYPPQFEGARAEVYKEIGDVKLQLFLFEPADHQSTDHRAAIVFFFGGGWRNGSPAQFEQQCRYLASRGMVAMTADYRVASRNATKAVSCVADAKSAIRWVRANAGRLGIDPQRIVAAGGSAGGHIAGCTGVLDGFEESGEDLSTGARPNAMVLFNPALVLASVDGEEPLPELRREELRERMGVEPELLSPFHHVAPGVPPTIIFHGEKDTTVPVKTARLFGDAMLKAGNRCELIGYAGQTHGFFNYGRNDNQYYRQTLLALDQFLVSLGYLNGPATLEQ